MQVLFQLSNKKKRKRNTLIDDWVVSYLFGPQVNQLVTLG